jgi:hypothetical protein
MLDTILAKLTKAVTRRTILGRAASAASAFTFALFRSTAKAGTPLCGSGYTPRYCCCLCSPHFCVNLKNCAATWCWTCELWEGSSCGVFSCTECYSSPLGCTNSGTACDGTSNLPYCPNCAYISCSVAQDTTIPCGGE